MGLTYIQEVMDSFGPELDAKAFIQLRDQSLVTAKWADEIAEAILHGATLEELYEKFGHYPPKMVLKK